MHHIVIKVESAGRTCEIGYSHSRLDGAVHILLVEPLEGRRPWIDLPLAGQLEVVDHIAEQIPACDRAKMRIFRATGKDFDAANANSFSEFYYSNCEGHLEFLADATALYNLYRAFPRVLAHLKIYREKEFYS